MQNNPTRRKKYRKDGSHSDDLVISLIHLVRQNPVLFNYKLQPNQRRRSDILNGWAQISQQLGNRLSVEECRRKWKNLRDTYHQYRLRKPKVGDGLNKWRYAKELDFLSNIYQPKLKTDRIKYEQSYPMAGNVGGMVHGVKCNISEIEHVDDLQIEVQEDDGLVDSDGMVGHSNITLVGDDAETFILHAYEESVNGDIVLEQTSAEHTDSMDNVSHIDMGSHDGSNIGAMEVKNENMSSLADDDDNIAEVDYEEVCMYEEAGTSTPIFDAETIISPTTPSDQNDNKEFQYLAHTDYCLESVSMQQHTNMSANLASAVCSLKNISNSSIKISTSNKLNNNYKNILSTCTPINANTPSSTAAITSLSNSISNNNNNIVSSFVSTSPNNTTSYIQIPATDPTSLTSLELDLFFEFLKNKVRSLSQEDITSIQIDFLNCVRAKQGGADDAANN